MTETWIRALILVCTFAAVALVAERFIGAVVRNRSAGNAINERLRLIAGGQSRDEAYNLLRRAPGLASGRLPSFLGGAGTKLERLLVAARVRMRTERVLLMLLLTPLILFLLICTLLFTAGRGIGAGNILIIAAFAIAAGLLLPLFFLQAMANANRKKMQTQFPIALDVFVRGLRAGHPVAAALDMLTVEMPDPIGSEFGIVVDEVTYGAELRDALQAMADRWDMEELRMFVVSLSIQTETGGNLAEILDNLANVIRDRASLFMKVRALSSEGRMTAVILTLLPILAFAGLFASAPEFYLDVSDDPFFLPGFGALILLYAVGFFIIRRLIDLKV